jgi:hypothetical protein
MHDEHWNGTLANHFLGVAAGDCTSEPAASVRTHDNQVAIADRGFLDDRYRGRSVLELANDGLYGQAL